MAETRRSKLKTKKGRGPTFILKDVGQVTEVFGGEMPRLLYRSLKSSSNESSSRSGHFLIRTGDKVWTRVGSSSDPWINGSWRWVQKCTSRLMTAVGPRVDLVFKDACSLLTSSFSSRELRENDVKVRGAGRSFTWTKEDFMKGFTNKYPSTLL